MRIALALGSGGARGYAHIGVVEELRSRGHEITAIAGSSMGAVIGGLEAADRLDPFTEWVTTLTQRDVWMLLDPAFTGPGVFWGRRVMDRVATMLEGARIEDLAVPFTAVATDLNGAREVWFQRGSVATAMRASIGIPSVFTPVAMQGRLLADGGILNPVPVEPLTGTAADVTVAVSLSGRRSSDTGRQPVSESADAEGLLGDLDRLRRGVLESDAVRGLRQWWADRFASGDDEVPEPDEVRDFDFDDLPRGLRTSDVVSLSLETAEAMITRFRMAASPPDVLIEMPLDTASTFDFHRAAELIEAGRAVAGTALDAAGL